MDSSQILSQKDGQTFRGISKLHDSKQFKKALKVCDGLLKNNPNHGETISMKAMTLNYLGRKEEALQQAKMGLMKTKMKSYVSWNVLGHIHRTNRNYVEAGKALKKAYGILNDREGETPNEVQHVLREVASLQVQTMDIEGLLDTRQKILVLPRQGNRYRENWCGFR